METSRQTLEDMAKITSGAGASSEDEVDVIGVTQLSVLCVIAYSGGTSTAQQQCCLSPVNISSRENVGCETFPGKCVRIPLDRP